MKEWIMLNPAISMILGIGIIFIIAFVVNEIRTARFEDEANSDSEDKNPNN